mmetsp:Transcript_3764/g.7771  ORF Transcript_3764/g.7771 Transcript_3764/m.7771 type:complete len:221 (-) Transcript_3764:61-723(-)
MFSDRDIILRNLVTLGKVRIEVLFAVEFRLRGDLAVHGFAHTHGLLHDLGVQHRQRPRVAHAHGADVRVWLTPILRLAAAEGLCGSVKLNVHLYSYYGLKLRLGLHGVGSRGRLDLNPPLPMVCLRHRPAAPRKSMNRPLRVRLLRFALSCEWVCMLSRTTAHRCARYNRLPPCGQRGDVGATFRVRAGTPADSGRAVSGVHGQHSCAHLCTSKSRNYSV